MNTGSNKFLKMGAVALLSVGILGACQSDDNKDQDVDVEQPGEMTPDAPATPGTDPETDTGSEPDVDVDVDNNDADDNPEGPTDSTTDDTTEDNSGQ